MVSDGHLEAGESNSIVAMSVLEHGGAQENTNELSTRRSHRLQPIGVVLLKSSSTALSLVHHNSAERSAHPNRLDSTRLALWQRPYLCTKPLKCPAVFISRGFQTQRWAREALGIKAQRDMNT